MKNPSNNNAQQTIKHKLKSDRHTVKKLYHLILNYFPREASHCRNSKKRQYNRRTQTTNHQSQQYLSVSNKVLRVKSSAMEIQSMVTLSTAQNFKTETKDRFKQKRRRKSKRTISSSCETERIVVQTPETKSVTWTVKLYESEA